MVAIAACMQRNVPCTLTLKMRSKSCEAGGGNRTDMCDARTVDQDVERPLGGDGCEHPADTLRVGNIAGKSPAPSAGLALSRWQLPRRPRRRYPEPTLVPHCRLSAWRWLCQFR